MYVQTYSPWLGRFESDANSEFALGYSCIALPALVQFNCSTADVTMAPGGTRPAPPPMSVGNFIRP